MSAIELTPTEFDIVWHELGLGRVPYPLAVPSAGATAGERARLADQVHGALRARGLWDGVPHRSLAVPLRVLARPDRSVDAVGQLGGPVRALTATGRGYGARAVLGPDGMLRLTEIHPDTTGKSVVDILPNERPGPGTVAPVPVAALTGPDDGYRSRDRTTLLALLATRTRGGQFGVTTTHPTGRPPRPRTLVNWFDTPEGRYLLVREGDWLSLSPADNHRIAQRLDRIHA